MIEAVRIYIGTKGWSVYKDLCPDGVVLGGDPRIYVAPNWSIGAIELARVLKRIGIKVAVHVEDECQPK